MVKMKSFGPNAPHKPSSAFILFLRYRCSQSSDLNSLPFVEKRRRISTEWASLAQEQKQIYIDQATAERKIYEEKFAEYKKTDEYKQWLAKNANNKSSRGKTGKFAKDMNGDADCFDDEFASKFRRIPIFTPEFLEYNRQREMQLRNLRKEVIKQEEETASFTAHIDSLASANTSMTQQIKSAEESLAAEEKLISKLKQELVASFSSLQLPSLESSTRSPSKAIDRIASDNVDLYLSKLAELVNSGHNEALKAKAKECLIAALQSKSLSLCSL
ncbi:hypothetical protein Aperf_G00000004772 [Anoplocephala perfoliata]